MKNSIIFFLMLSSDMHGMERWRLHDGFVTLAMVQPKRIQNKIVQEDIHLLDSYMPYNGPYILGTPVYSTASTLNDYASPYDLNSDNDSDDTSESSAHSEYESSDEDPYEFIDLKKASDEIPCIPEKEISRPLKRQKFENAEQEKTIRKNPNNSCFSLQCPFCDHILYIIDRGHMNAGFKNHLQKKHTQKTISEAEYIEAHIQEPTIQYTLNAQCPLASCSFSETARGFLKEKYRLARQLKSHMNTTHKTGSYDKTIKKYVTYTSSETMPNHESDDDNDEEDDEFFTPINGAWVYEIKCPYSCGYVKKTVQDAESDKSLVRTNTIYGLYMHLKNRHEKWDDTRFDAYVEKNLCEYQTNDTIIFQSYTFSIKCPEKKCTYTKKNNSGASCSPKRAKNNVYDGFRAHVKKYHPQWDNKKIKTYFKHNTQKIKREL